MKPAEGLRLDRQALEQVLRAGLGADGSRESIDVLGLADDVLEWIQGQAIALNAEAKLKVLTIPPKSLVVFAYPQRLSAKERDAIVQRLRVAIARVQPTAYVTILEEGLEAHAVIQPTEGAQAP